jgi:hypothetical protein
MNKAAPYKTLLPLMILLGLGLLMAGSASDAIDLKDPVNLNQLGYALMIKDSTQVDLARTYFSKAAALNYPAAIYNLAVLDDIEGKYPQAAQGYLKAAKLMLPEAACQIGLIYSVGIGLPQNDLQAYRWLLFGSAYASDQERDFWLDLKDEVATRLSQTEIRTIQNEVSELAQKQTLVGDEGRKEILIAYIYLENPKWKPSFKIPTQASAPAPTIIYRDGGGDNSTPKEEEKPKEDKIIITGGELSAKENARYDSLLNATRNWLKYGTK